MVFGLLNPVNLVLSMLLMQGISLSMFRNIVNQTIRRNDNPLKWNVSFGNDNKTVKAGSPESERSSSTNADATSSPLVDPRLMDLVNLLRVLGNQQQPPSSASVQTHQPLIALPVQTNAPPATARPPVPQIIIVPQLLKASPSDSVELVAKPVISESESQTTETFSPETVRSWSNQEEKALRKIFRNKSKNGKNKHRNALPKSVADLKRAANHRYEQILEDNPAENSFLEQEDVLNHLESRKARLNHHRE